MKLRILVALAIFFGSYLPLSLILLAQDYDYSFFGRPICVPWHSSGCLIPFKNWTLSVPIFVVSAICFAGTLTILGLLKPKRPVTVREAQHVPADLMNYTLPYVVSFMSLDYQEAGKLVGLLIFLGWMFFITYRSGQIILNPVLIAFGWRLYDVTVVYPGSDTEHSARTLAFGHVAAGERHHVREFQDVLIIKPSEG